METNPSCACPEGRRNVVAVTTRYFVIGGGEEGEANIPDSLEGNRAQPKKGRLVDQGRGGDLINHPGRGSILSSYGNPVNYMRRSVSYLWPILIVIFRAGGILPFFLPFDQNFLVQRNCGSRCFSFPFFRRKQGEKLSRLFFVELFTNFINTIYKHYEYYLCPINTDKIFPCKKYSMKQDSFLC